jgi:DnaK suppressor protein
MTRKPATTNDQLRRQHFDAIRGALLAKQKLILSTERSVDIYQTADDLERIQQVTIRDVEATLADTEAKRLKEITAALTRLSDDTYGVCEQCDEEISLARLLALPWARLCVFCQQLAEAQLAFESTDSVYANADED